MTLLSPGGWYALSHVRAHYWRRDRVSSICGEANCHSELHQARDEIACGRCKFLLSLEGSPSPAPIVEAHVHSFYWVKRRPNLIGVVRCARCSYRLEFMPKTVAEVEAALVEPEQAGGAR